MNKFHSSIACITVSLLLTLCISSTPVEAQQETRHDNMSPPQEMMMRQMAIRAQQDQGNNRDEFKNGSPQNTIDPHNYIMGILDQDSGSASIVNMGGQNRQQTHSMMMGANMGQGMMMAYPMMGFANGQDLVDMAAYEKFIKESREMRRTLHNKRFDFKEAFWIPETTLQELRDMAKEINALQQELNAKMPAKKTKKE